VTHTDTIHPPVPVTRAPGDEWTGGPDGFMEWAASHQVAATTAALRAYAAQICEAEIARALARLRGISAGDALLVRALAQRIVGKLLHRPTTVLKTDAEGANMAHVLRQLFQLEPQVERPGCVAEARTDSPAR
jgi:hypothetical protein